MPCFVIEYDQMHHLFGQENNPNINELNGSTIVEQATTTTPSISESDLRNDQQPVSHSNMTTELTGGNGLRESRRSLHLVISLFNHFFGSVHYLFHMAIIQITSVRFQSTHSNSSAHFIFLTQLL
uniref:Uncharacterized protein n=1 Tax=Schistosoma mansoni TaxID=6183 RepID=A0A5K4FA26_SCHMA